MTDVDISELLDYARHLETAIDRAEPQLSKVVERGALNVKRGAQSRLSGISRRHYLKHYYRSLGYDMLNPLEAEVGPDPGHLQGKMGRGVEFGSAHTPPFAHLLPAADEEEPRFGQQALNILWRSLK